MSSVAIPLEICNCHKYTYCQVWLKDSRTLIIIFRVVQENIVQIKTEAKEISASELILCTVCVKGNVSQCTKSCVIWGEILTGCVT